MSPRKERIRHFLLGGMIAEAERTLAVMGRPGCEGQATVQLRTVLSESRKRHCIVLEGMLQMPFAIDPSIASSPGQLDVLPPLLELAIEPNVSYAEGKMFTLIHGHSAQSVKVASMDGDVEVTVRSSVVGLPNASLSREEAHDALLEAKEKTTDFIAALEADLEATAA